ncbi:hypothetical protein AZ66_16725 [Paenibacillus sp. E194]|uniref:hypothetical protein n=1 Tax=Paenibacillus sp. E194 TaxID=1458845 RepID=UPI0005CAE1B8|nr:hypothetical protein [Paenibacillus sp. E194]KJB86804.1 hypothetical protein AZ66_16725 [Paenibacillus sp. E194]
MTVLCFCVMLSTIGCSSTEWQQYTKLAEAFKQAQYDVPDYTQITGHVDQILGRYERIKPFLTRETYNQLYRNRTLAIALGTAKKQQCNIEVTSFQLQEQSETEAEPKTVKSMSFTYSMTMLLRDAQGQLIEVIEVPAGQMDFAIQDGGLFILSDRDGEPLMSKYN